MSEPADGANEPGRPAPLDYAGPMPPRPHRSFRPPITLIVLFILGGLVWFADSFMGTGYRAPEQASRVKCASNMRQIGQGVELCANDHDGRFPDDLETVLANEDLTPQAFVCPSSKDTPAPTAAAPQATAAGLRQAGHCTYVYIGKGLTTDMTTPDMIVMFEPLGDHHGDGMNVMFADFHVEWFSKSDGQAILNRVASGVRPVHDPTTAPATAPAAGQGN